MDSTRFKYAKSNNKQGTMDVIRRYIKESKDPASVANAFLYGFVLGSRLKAEEIDDVRYIIRELNIILESCKEKGTV